MGCLCGKPKGQVARRCGFRRLFLRWCRLCPPHPRCQRRLRNARWSKGQSLLGHFWLIHFRKMSNPPPVTIADIGIWEQDRSTSDGTTHKKESDNAQQNTLHPSTFHKHPSLAFSKLTFLLYLKPLNLPNDFAKFPKKFFQPRLDGWSVLSLTLFF